MNSQLQPTPVLSDTDAALRMRLLAALQAALSDRGARCVLARNHKLVLRDQGPVEPSGLTDPKLHVFLSGRSLCVTTDNHVYTWLAGRESPVDNPAAAAAAICDAAASWSR